MPYHRKHAKASILQKHAGKLQAQSIASKSMSGFSSYVADDHQAVDHEVHQKTVARLEKSRLPLLKSTAPSRAACHKVETRELMDEVMRLQHEYNRLKAESRRRKARSDGLRASERMEQLESMERKHDAVEYLQKQLWAIEQAILAEAKYEESLQRLRAEEQDGSCTTRDELRTVRAESRAVSQQLQRARDKGVLIAAQRARTDRQIAHLRRRLENQEALRDRNMADMSLTESTRLQQVAEREARARRRENVVLAEAGDLDEEGERELLLLTSAKQLTQAQTKRDLGSVLQRLHLMETTMAALKRVTGQTNPEALVQRYFSQKESRDALEERSQDYSERLKQLNRSLDEQQLRQQEAVMHDTERRGVSPNIIYVADKLHVCKAVAEGRRVKSVKLNMVLLESKESLWRALSKLSGALGADRTATREQLPLMPSLTAAKKEWLSLPVMSLEVQHAALPIEQTFHMFELRMGHMLRLFRLVVPASVHSSTPKYMPLPQRARALTSGLLAMGIGRRRSIAGSSDEEEEEEEEQEQRVKERPASGRVQDADTATTMNSKAELGTIAGPRQVQFTRDTLEAHDVSLPALKGASEGSPKKSKRKRRTSKKTGSRPRAGRAASAMF